MRKRLKKKLRKKRLLAFEKLFIGDGLKEFVECFFVTRPLPDWLLKNKH